MATFNAFALLDSDEENESVFKKFESKPKKKTTKSKSAKPVNQANQLNGNAPGNAPNSSPVPAGSGWDNKHDGEVKRRTDGRRGGRGGRGGYSGRNGREFDRRSGTGRGREMKKGGAGGHNWGQPDDLDAATTNDAEETTAVTENGAEGEAPAQQEVVQPPPEPEVVHLSLEEYEAQKAAKAEELAEHELFEEREELEVDEEDLEGLALKEEIVDTDEVLLDTDKKVGKKGRKKKSGRAKQLVTDVGFRPPPVERGGGRGGRGRGGPRRDFGGGRGAPGPVQNAAELDINAFPSLS